MDPAVDTYFASGNYWFDLPDTPDDSAGWITIGAGQQVSVGHPGTYIRLPELTDSCEEARRQDQNVGGSGATFFLSGDSRIRVNPGGSLEMFPRQQGDFFVSIRAIGQGEPYARSNFGTNFSVLRTWDGTASTKLVVHGLVWAPANRVVLDNFRANSFNWLAGGVVTLRLWIGDNWAGSAEETFPDYQFKIRPANAASDAEVKLRSQSTVDGVTTTVEAIVQYRPQANLPAERVAVKSSYVVDV
jgi:hypothetical protein